MGWLTPEGRPTLRGQTSQGLSAAATRREEGADVMARLAS
jgi:hypothetical protein